MDKFLLDHSIENVWCNPDQDNQLIFNAKRISKPSGVINNVTILNRQIKLPNNGKIYHVYQIGQIYPKILGLLPKNPNWVNESWIKFSDIMNSNKLFVSIYTDNGIEIPKFKSYYMHSNEKNLIFVIEQDNNISPDYSNENIYFRLYTNAFYQTNRSNNSDDFIYCSGRDIKTSDNILELQTEYLQYSNRDGYVFAYKNGYLIDKIDVANLTIGDTAEIIYDGSVSKVVTYVIDNLKTFNSILDSEYKYLFHYNDSVNDSIYFYDDTDIHIIYEKLPGRYKGHYVHRNDIKTHRMVTHKDYSLSVQKVFNFSMYLKNRLAIEEDIGSFKIQLKIRESGYHRPLIYDNNRIFELYKMNDSFIMNAMLGIDSTIDEWKAENLENSSYCKLMSSNFKDITNELIEQAYGYNSISKLVADNMFKTYLDSGYQTVKLPYKLQTKSCVYEYDSNGHLLGKYNHYSGVYYQCVNNNARLVEVISGLGTTGPEVAFGYDNISLPTDYNYRVYMSRVINGTSNNIWEDITGSSLYTVVDDYLVWNNPGDNQYLMIRDDSAFLAYDLTVNYVNNILFFTLSEVENRGSGFINYSLPVPLGDLDIFLNGKSLIENIDYIVDFPKVYILNKAYLNQPINTESQTISVRYTGFHNADISSNKNIDYGFIEYGYFSNNNKFDIRDDKVLRIAMDGKLIHKDDIMFSELTSGAFPISAINGKPYQIKDITTPLNNIIESDTYELRNKSLVIDKKISDYLSIKIPQPSRDSENVIVEQYPIVSLFISRIIYAVTYNEINNTTLVNILSDNDIIDLCKPYEYLLKYDPISGDLSMSKGLAKEYLLVHPHSLDSVIILNLYQYRFLLNVVRLYGNGLINLSPFISVVG